MASRLSLYEELKKENDALLAWRAAESKSIRVDMPDGREVEAKAWLTTPYQLACDIRLVVVQCHQTANIWAAKADAAFITARNHLPQLNDCVCVPS